MHWDVHRHVRHADSRVLDPSSPRGGSSGEHEMSREVGGAAHRGEGRGGGGRGDRGLVEGSIGGSCEAISIDRMVSKYRTKLR